jgi:DNA-binding transcriptional regulator GbsR (MarR family)
VPNAAGLGAKSARQATSARRNAVAVLKPRERLVYFRVSEDEFHQFVSVCEQEGARSVSDLARNAVQRLIAECQRNREERELTPKVAKLEELVIALTGQVQTLAALLRGQDSARAAGASAEGGPLLLRAEASASREE